MSAIEMGALDYNKDISQHSKSDIINHYLLDQATDLQDKFDKEEDGIEEAEYNKGVDNLFSTASTLYLRDKKDWDAQIKLTVERSAELKQNFSSSVEESIEALDEKYPDFGDDEKNSIKNHLEKKDILGMFYSPDGTVTKEAAKLLAFMLYGEAEVERQAEKSASRASSQATQEVVTRADKKPKKAGSGNQENNKKQIADALKIFDGVLPTGNPFSNALQLEEKKS